MIPIVPTSTKARGEFASATDQINLTLTTYSPTTGQPADPDTLPSITIQDPTGLVNFGPSTAGIMRLDTGKFLYQYMVPVVPALGVYNDIWSYTMGGNYSVDTLSFIVSNTDTSALVTADGYVALGDDPGFNYSQLAIRNINSLIKTLKARLNSAGKAKSSDSFGNTIYVTCDIFSTDMYVSFLANTITEFNMIPYFTHFTFEDTAFIEEFHAILVQGASIMAMAGSALISRGQEYTINDNGVSFTPPSVSELLSTEWSTELSNYLDKLKYLKNSIRSKPLGLGTFSMTSGGNVPVIRRLQNLRQRRLF